MEVGTREAVVVVGRVDMEVMIDMADMIDTVVTIDTVGMAVVEDIGNRTRDLDTTNVSCCWRYSYHYSHTCLFGDLVCRYCVWLVYSFLISFPHIGDLVSWFYMWY